MTELRTLHTADLGARILSQIRGLMDAAFDGVSDDTYENVLGSSDTDLRSRLRRTHAGDRSGTTKP